MRKKPIVRCLYCDRPAAKRALCNKHYLRLIRHGSPLYQSKRENGEGTIMRGYRLITVNGVQVYEHRHVMKQHLGRPLTGDEIVHHLDGDKLNNTVENLEVLTRRAHPHKHPDHLQAWQKAGLPARWKKETTRRK